MHAPVKHTRVIIVEDDTALRQSLIEWLSIEHTVCSYESAEQLLDAIRHIVFHETMPTCLLIDLQLCGMNGIELQSKLRQMNVQMPVLFMSGNAHQADIIDAWHGGAANFLLKPFTGTKVSQALGVIFNTLTSAQTQAEREQPRQDIVDLPISRREAEVLLLLGKGYRQLEIAQMLNISLRTVKWHRASIKNKLNLNTLVELARYCDHHMNAIESIAKPKVGTKVAD